MGSRAFKLESSNLSAVRVIMIMISLLVLVALSKLNMSDRNIGTC